MKAGGGIKFEGKIQIQFGCVKDDVAVQSVNKDGLNTYQAPGRARHQSRRERGTESIRVPRGQETSQRSAGCGPA